ncbi:MAG: NUDIX hydrolase [Planctomycetia bacterium]|nr:NUDIX hydrolase [Planctomycetia bacterium]
MANKPIPIYAFALVVVRLDDRFLVVQERKHGQLWYLPAGRIELAETIEEGAIREVYEESGVQVTLTGVLKVMYTPQIECSRLRVLFLAKPTDDPTPRTEPNKHTLAARWVTLAELDALPLRGEEVRSIFTWVANGAPSYPMELLGIED